MARRDTPDRGLHQLPSGLIHTADSLADAPHGMFVDRFGPPGDPTAAPAVSKEREPGVQPKLLEGLAGNKRKRFD